MHSLVQRARPRIDWRKLPGALLFLAFTLVWARVVGAAPAPPCVSSVQLDGDQALADSVRAYLHARGIETDTAPGCGTLLITLSDEGGRVRVDVKDPAGQSDSRLVSDSATASAFVESRVRTDLAFDALPEPEPGFTPAPASHEPVLAAARAGTSREEGASQIGKDGHAPVSLRFRPGVSFGSDGSSWVDLAVSGCVAVDPLCVGATARGSLDLGLSGRSADLLTERGGLDVLVTAEAPFSPSQTMRLSPGIGIGAGWLRSAPRGAAETPTGSEVSANFGSLRIDVFTRAAWPIADRWSLGVAAHGTVDPFAPEGDIRDPAALLAGNPLLRAGVAFELTYGAP